MIKDKLDIVRKLQVRCKPEFAQDFLPPVAWLMGRQIISNLKWFALYGLFKGKLDHRDWMNPNVLSFATGSKTFDGISVDPVKRAYPEREKEFWFDYIADSGDGQLPVYNIAYMCLSDIWLKGCAGEFDDVDFNKIQENLPVVERKNNKNELNSEHPLKASFSSGDLCLPRGEFLFVGGDTSYHVADWTTLHERFQSPFCWAYLETAVTDTRPLVSIPGNHDYYDSLDGFNRQFRVPSTGENLLNSVGNERKACLTIPAFERHQQASYFAVELPFGWWLWALDTESGELDYRQGEFFRKLRKHLTEKKLILATSQPTTAFQQTANPKADLSMSIKKTKNEWAKPDDKDQPFLSDGQTKDEEIRLDLSGDVHHYARYWGPKRTGNSKNRDNYASVVSGLGGAFLHPSDTAIRDKEDRRIEPNALFPTVLDSRKEVYKHLFLLRRVGTGGIVPFVGAFIALIIYFGLETPLPTNTLRQQVISLLQLKLGDPWYFTPSIIPLSIAFSSLALLIGAISLSARTDENTTEYFKGQHSRTSPSFYDLHFVPFWILFLSSLALCFVLHRYFPANGMSYFIRTLMVLTGILWAIGAEVQAIVYSAWLAKIAALRPARRSDSLFYWLFPLTGVAVLSFFIYKYGRNLTVTAFIWDLIFAIVLFGLLIALIVVAFAVGASRSGGWGKFLFSVFGFWHAILQLFVPYLFITHCNLELLSLGLLLITLANFIGYGLAKSGKSFRLLFLWFAFGLTMLASPHIFIEKGIHWKIMAKDGATFSLLWNTGWFVLIGGIGFIWTVVCFAWYLAVSIAHNGHNNEVGGAVRVSSFKEMIRIRITEDTLTAFVIGFINPEIEAKDLKLEVIDVFQLKKNPAPSPNVKSTTEEGSS